MERTRNSPLPEPVLRAIQADWRYAIPDDLTKPNGPKHPVLYVGGHGGVYRSLDKGVTWTYFPNIATDGSATSLIYSVTAGFWLVLALFMPTPRSENTGSPNWLVDTYSPGV